MADVPSKNRCTGKDVAKRAGVSAMSVSLAFQGSEKLSRVTRDKIFKAARELRYVPDQNARQLRSGRTDLIGFLTPDFANPFHTLMMKQIESRFIERGMTLIFGSSGWNVQQEKKFVEKMIRMRVRGVLLCPTEKNPELFRSLDDAGIPYVVLDSAPENYAGYGVLNDLRACGRLIAGHLADSGARRIAYIDAAPERLAYSAFAQIGNAFRDELTARGLTLPESLHIPAGLTLEAGSEAFHKLTENHEPLPEAVFCVNDLCALGFMNEAEKANLTPGADFALAGIDDMAFSAMERISLTTVRQPYETLAEAAAEMLALRLEGIEPENRRIFASPELIVRNTTRNYHPEKKEK